MSERTIYWEGQAGNTYKYWIYPLGTTFDAAPGNYIFAKETEPRRFWPIYIGQTENLAESFEDHHKKECVKNNGATHIHAHKSTNNEAIRKAEESDLIRKWKPLCNDLS